MRPSTQFVKPTTPQASPCIRPEGRDYIRDVAVRPEDGRLVTDVIYTEWALIPHPQRPHSHWVVDPDMLDFVSAAIRALYPWEWGPTTQLLGRPVELRTGAQGIHLEVG